MMINNIECIFFSAVPEKCIEANFRGGPRRLSALTEEHRRQRIDSDSFLIPGIGQRLHKPLTFKLLGFEK